ncbi:BnaA01g31200D [Brassica napus]|uniref:BnaA01g31200D protein n=1 Tax=Brassica napus TaxID=3708 RepID=A0A078HHM6_BRANA|nr:BnaA01g31200D [Brassica napus]
MFLTLKKFKHNQRCVVFPLNCIDVKSHETSNLGLLLGFSSPSHETKSILVAPQEPTPRLDHMFLKCLVTSEQTVSEWTVYETSLYVALLGHISIKDHHVQLLQQNLVSLPPATSWVIEAHNLELVLGKSGSRILKVKLEWRQTQLEDSVLPVYNVYAENVKSTDVLRSRKVLEKPRSERVFLGISHVPAYYVSELVLDSDVKGVSFVVQPCERERESTGMCLHVRGILQSYQRIEFRNLTAPKFLETFRTSVGAGIVLPTSLFRTEVLVLITSRLFSVHFIE